MTDVHDILTKQLTVKRLEQKRSIARQIAQLNYLSPVFVRHLRLVENYSSLFLRAFVLELKRCNHSFASLMGIVNSSADFEADEFFEFSQHCVLLAGMDLASETGREFWTNYQAAKKCELCSRSYRLHALSHSVLLEPFCMEFCHEMSHSGDLMYAHVCEPLYISLDALI